MTQRILLENEGLLIASNLASIQVAQGSSHVFCPFQLLMASGFLFLCMGSLLTCAGTIVGPRPLVTVPKKKKGLTGAGEGHDTCPKLWVDHL